MSFDRREGPLLCRLALGLGGLCATHANGVAQDAGDWDAGLLLSVRNQAQLLLDDPRISSASIGLCLRGAEYTEHFGELERGSGVAPNDETFYEIASVSKTFAGIVVAHAVAEGKLALEDDVRDLIDGDYPALQHEGEPVRLKHLLSHTSGLPHFLPERLAELYETVPGDRLAFEVDAVRRNYTKADFLLDLAGIAPSTPPGSRYVYSNVNTELVAHILERAYARPYTALVRDFACAPAGLSSTKFDLSEDESDRLAVGYGEGDEPMPSFATQLWGAGAGLKSTVPDLVRYMEHCLSGRSPAVRAALEPVHEVDGQRLGYFWPIDEDEQMGRYHGHHGGSYGMQLWLFLFPERELGLVVVTNQSDRETNGKLLGAVNGILAAVP